MSVLRVTLSIRTTLVLAVLVAVIAPLAIWLTVQQNLFRSAFQPLVVENRQAQLNLAVSALVEPLWTLNETGITAVLDRTVAQPGVLSLRLEETRPTDDSHLVVHQRVRADLPPGTVPPPGAVCLQAPVLREGQSLGELQVCYDPDQLDRAMASRRWELFKLAALQAAMAALLVMGVLYHRLIRPLDRLKAQASRIALRGEEATMSWRHMDEIGELGEHLNDVHRQLHTLFGQIERQQQALEKLALHDHLTGLPNRLLFRELAQAACATALRDGHALAVLFIDLDRFKVVNDTLGHSAGDALLKTIAQRLSSSVRASDAVCRHSGDEFLLLLQDYGSLEQLMQTVERIQREVARPMMLEGREAHVTASIGIALLPDDAREPDELVRHADLAMYEAKKAGSNGHGFYRAELNQRVQAQMEVERELREALARDEFELHFQPQIGAARGELLGCEALIRWRHPQRGLVPPLSFIPAAEQAGLIGEIGVWVVRAACAQIARWKAEGLAFGCVAVNLSANEFRDSALVDTVRDAMQQHGVRPDEFEIEITETVLMTEAAALRIVADLQALGISIAVDDFGTGYSSLAYLKRLRPRTIKIDRGFLKDLPEDEEDRVVVEAIVGIAQALGIEVVAEGVETEAQRDYLCGAGCHILQGYLIARPADAQQYAQWLAARPPDIVSA
ncbi:putative bifunctional diguanylate cyclase/phosphodiesterase [Sphaerotilus mobilis]|uniref:Diguanylate cyclase (GGDEF)-like protein n=1 Tax=Sphaerotilus mobilis TaxID=47994 RepID=A0A4Q7LWI2_9BURK|nr:EAL domain-containing protein [Sphaerotilus mobilis]RZS58129.1 diguanylate cyclase (GGDEF)-like protein [Sphaerotilus mobilis]